MILLKRTAFKDKHKTQDHWKDTIYLIEGQPYVGLPVFKITPIAGEGKVKVAHQNLLLPFEGNIKGGPENEESQQDVNGPQDCILTVSDYGVYKLWTSKLLG